MWSMVAQRFTQITSQALHQINFAAWSAVPQEHIQSLFESMPRSEDSEGSSRRLLAFDIGRGALHLLRWVGQPLGTLHDGNLNADRTFMTSYV
ncbi:hypothetical protein TNCV_5084781 [Trichonephila clavipes]|uniref:Uncharacterized protein n=1 Tax=Trichonephila clavipes TaxID=2585209 RepID=A0A8X6S7T7_TRICX|nr:hypothetical protein TNCV_5084781 [Trichonephila clavipes]